MSIIKLERKDAGTSVSPTPKLRKSERTRKAILDSALELLWSRPFREVTITDLMSVTGIGRSTFYQYFDDLYGVMALLLLGLEEEVLEAAAPWFSGKGDPTAMLNQSLAGLVRVCYENGPILRAVSDASVTDKQFEKLWSNFLEVFDDAVAAQIEKHQAQGLIAPLDARPIAVALNRLDASLLIHCFGSHPRSNPDVVQETLARIWMSTLYASELCPGYKKQE
jgi:AcrR family transcriptional regulator